MPNYRAKAISEPSFTQGLGVLCLEKIWFGIRLRIWGLQVRALPGAPAKALKTALLTASRVAVRGAVCFQHCVRHSQSSDELKPLTKLRGRSGAIRLSDRDE